VKTSQDLFKQLDEVEALFSKGSIKIAQKKLEKLLQNLKN
jgi:soluble cytochrome b562